MALIRNILLVTICYIVAEASITARGQEVYESEPELHRATREIQLTFPGSDRIPKPPTALCFREPCNVPGGFRPPQRGFRPNFGGRFRRSEPIEEETFEVEPETHREPREIKVTFPGSDRIPKPPTALCFREPCNVPGGFRPPQGGFRPYSGGRFRRSESIDDEETYEVEPETHREPREIKVTFPGSDRIPKPPTALCFREPCNVPGGFRPPQGGFRPYSGGRFRRSESIDDEENYEPEPELRVAREIKVTFPGSDRIPKPPTALCFRQPCNVPGGLRPPKGGRF